MQSLDLQQTNVGDKGLEHLKGLTSLRELNVRQTKVTDAGVANLRKSLPKLKITR